MEKFSQKLSLRAERSNLVVAGTVLVPTRLLRRGGYPELVEGLLAMTLLL